MKANELATNYQVFGFNDYAVTRTKLTILHKVIVE